MSYKKVNTQTAIKNRVLKRKEQELYTARISKAKRSKKKKKEYILTADCETFTNSTDYTYIWSFAWYDGKDCYISADEKDMHSLIEYGGYYMVHFNTFLNYLLDTYDKYTEKVIVYIHNLKFDLEFFRRYLIENVKLKDLTGYTPKGLRDLDNYVTYLISDMGAVYNLKMKIQGLEIKFIDSFKFIPMALSKATKDFKISNLKEDYNIVNDCYLKPENQVYIENDVIGLYQCIKKFREIGKSDKNTIASCAYDVFTQGFGANWEDYKATNFPELTLDQDKFLRRAYRGAFCYVNKKYQGEVINKLCDCYDVNSLYPYIMNSSRLLPVGYPLVSPPKSGKYVSISEVNVKATVKENAYPFLFSKGFLGFKKALYFEEIDTYTEGKTLTFTNVDIEMLYKYYDVAEFEYIKTYYFKTKKGCDIFGKYLDYFAKMKVEHAKEKDAYYAISKLFQNSLYGKFGGSYTFGTYKYVFDPENEVKCTIKELDFIENKPTESTYVPIAGFITAYAREYIASLIMKNPKAFLYCDTDSIHMFHVDNNGLPIDSAKYGALKLEYQFNHAIYVRQKTYLEMGTDGDIKMGFCGLSKDGQTALANHIKDGTIKIEDIKHGFSIEGKRQMKRVRGGYIIASTTFLIK